MSVFHLKDLPKLKNPEIILCGRSNVGKSSFLNTIFNRKNIAKTSSTPGKTRSLNYYLVNEKFFIVDLPGFGYAKVSKKEREAWQNLVDGYIQSDRNFVHAFHFIDSRHEPSTLDLMLNEFITNLGIPFTIILSKIDKLNQSEISKAEKSLKSYFPDISYYDDVIKFSATKGFGKKMVLNKIDEILN
jgi:GTP-binding protein